MKKAGSAAYISRERPSRTNDAAVRKKSPPAQGRSSLKNAGTCGSVLNDMKKSETTTMKSSAFASTSTAAPSGYSRPYSFFSRNMSENSPERSGRKPTAAVCTETMEKRPPRGALSLRSTLNRSAREKCPRMKRVNEPSR